METSAEKPKVEKGSATRHSTADANMRPEGFLKFILESKPKPWETAVVQSAIKSTSEYKTDWIFPCIAARFSRGIWAEIRSSK